MEYPYKAKISDELDHSKFYRGKLVSPGHVVEISGPEDEKIWKGFLIPFHVETEEEKEAAIAKPFTASFVHGNPGASGFANLSNEFKGKPGTPPASTNDSDDTKEEGSKPDEGTPDSSEKPGTPPDDSKIPSGTDKPSSKAGGKNK